jgi:chromosome partitioning protein
MPVIVVANPKGGVGKSTLATQLAGCLAAAGHSVMLGDVDRQQSARQWLALRPPACPARRASCRAAGLHGKRLEAVLKIADRMLVPLAASLFDIQATHAFVNQVRQHRRAGEIDLGLVAMRVREHTRSHEQLQQYLDTLGVPVVAWLRDTQNYVQLAAHGLTLWDVAPSRVERDLEQWAALADWVRR